jgi:heat shock protein HtpX
MPLEENNRYLVREQQAKNRRKSKGIIVGLVLIILALSSSLGYYYLKNVFAGILLGVLVTAILVPLNFKISKMLIISATKGTLITSDTDVDKLRSVLMQVEGLSISAGLHRVPDVYVLPTSTPNAFAGGMDENSAYIGVTQGLLDLLDAEELEGVLAHEMAHILNLDIQLNTVITSLVSVIAILGELLWRGGGRKNLKKDSFGGLFAIIMLSALIISPFVRRIGQLLQLSASREREYLADATAIQLAGYNQGLIRALKKLSERDEAYTKKEQSELGGSHMLAMCMVNPGSKVNSKFSTHPPIAERIHLLENMY